MRSPRLFLDGSLVFAFVTAAFVTSCTTEKTAGPKACCDQPKVPAGIPGFTVIYDDVSGPTDGQIVKVRVALKQKTKRDDISPALQFLYRYAMQRNTFEPVSFAGEFYTSEGE